MTHRTFVDLVSLRRAKRRCGEVFQIKLRPSPECEPLPPAHSGKGVVIPGLQAFSENLLRLVPILSPGRLPLALSGFVPVLHPPDCRFRSSKQAAIMLYRSCHIPSPV